MFWSVMALYCTRGALLTHQSGQPVQVDEVVRTLARLCGADPSPVLATLVY